MTSSLSNVVYIITNAKSDFFTIQTTLGDENTADFDEVREVHFFRSRVLSFRMLDELVRELPKVRKRRATENTY